jgi:hypothetical protein
MRCYATFHCANSRPYDGVQKCIEGGSDTSQHQAVVDHIKVFHCHPGWRVVLVYLVL